MNFLKNPYAAAVIVLLLPGFLISFNKAEEVIPSMDRVKSSCELEQNGAVSADSEACEKVGRDILKRKGSAVDAAIATLLCMGLNHPQSSGLGGGFQMVYYNRTEQKAYFLDSRETAPAKSTVNMYEGDAERSTYGGLAIAVPGEVAGYEEAHRRFGRLPWKELFAPAIKMCREGISVSDKLANAILKSKENIVKHKSLRNTFLKNSKEPYVAGEFIKRPILARTLQIIASRGKKALYCHGKLHGGFLKDLKAAGSIIEKTDLLHYSPRMKTPSKMTLRNGLTLYSSTIPSSGALLAFMIGVLDGYSDPNQKVVKNTTLPVLTFHRMVEALKYAYAYRSQMEDSDTPQMNQLLQRLTSSSQAGYTRSLINDYETYDDPSHYGLKEVSNYDDEGTAHLSIVSPDGDAVSVTSTINGHFGSMVLSPSTGIILNNQMNDFSLPNITNMYGVMPGTKNQVKPGKSPMSSTVPSIFVDARGNVQLVIGGSGGTTITSSVFQVVARMMFFGWDLTSSIVAPRLHHQLLPNKLYYEESFPKEIIEALRQLGHKTKLDFGFNSYVVGIHRESDDKLCEYADHKKRD